MKRIILTLCCIISVVWFMPLFVHAAYTAPDGEDYEYYCRSLNYGSNWFYTIYSNQKICFCELSKNGSDYYPCGYITVNGTDYVGTIDATTNVYKGNINRQYPSGGVVSNSNYMLFFRDSVAPSGNNSFACSSSVNSTIPIFDTWEECLDYLTTPDIDFDTVYYSPLIPNVDFSVVLNTSGVPVNDINSTEYNAFNVNINSNVGTDYNIQIGYKVHVPNKMALGVNNNGTAYYSALTYNNAVFENVYSLEDNQVAFTGSVNNSLFEWTRQEVPSNDWTVVSSLQGNTSFINGSIMAYNDTMSYILPLYGKKLEIFMRYYVIQDNQIIVGAWSHWNNIYPTQYTQELPANYIPFHNVPGYQNTNNNTEYQENDNTVNSIGTSTGQNVTVYNNSVPNYPNYPTIVTYNHDNILLQTIETAKQLPQFFGEFSGFLAAAFVFIPSEIWTIIGFGFLCSIFVMIVKVL